MAPVSIIRTAKIHCGTYGTANGMLAVTYAGRIRRTQLGGMDALTLAEMIGTEVA